MTERIKIKIMIKMCFILLEAIYKVSDNLNDKRFSNIKTKLENLENVLKNIERVI